jgi:hypothetical protein
MTGERPNVSVPPMVWDMLTDVLYSYADYFGSVEMWADTPDPWGGSQPNPFRVRGVVVDDAGRVRVSVVERGGEHPRDVDPSVFHDYEIES